eukprot:365133-Chlamydomonas_euryale.AAC.1
MAAPRRAGGQEVEGLGIGRPWPRHGGRAGRKRRDWASGVHGCTTVGGRAGRGGTGHWAYMAAPWALRFGLEISR